VYCLNVRKCTKLRIQKQLYIYLEVIYEQREPRQVVFKGLTDENCSVVREPGDDEMVERPLAQRGIRLLCPEHRRRLRRA
jgi:hypothetical protein